MKIVQIDSIKGLITAVFVCACAFAGFVISPGYVAMTLWNKYLALNYMFPTLSIFQGILLWGIIVISYFIITGNGFALSFKNTPEMSDEELNAIIKSAKINAQMRMMNHLISKTDKVDIKKLNKDGKTGENKESPFISPSVNFRNNQSIDKSDEDSISKIK